MLLNFICAEILKTKQARVIWIAILLPTIIPIILVLNIWNTPLETYLANLKYTGEGNPWFYFSSYCFIVSGLIAPIISTTIVILLNYIEKQASAWKFILTFPLNYSQIFIGKFMISLFWAFVAFFVYYLTFALLINIFALTHPIFGFKDILINNTMLASVFLRTFFCAIAPIPLIWLVCLHFKSFLAFGFFIPIIGLLIRSILLPFTYSFETLGLIQGNRKWCFLHGQIQTIKNILVISKYEVATMCWLIIGVIFLIFYVQKNKDKING